MSDESDRIAVPTNGRKPHPAPAPAPLAPLRGEPPTAGPEPSTETLSRLSIGVEPKSLAIGFGVIASLILLAVGRSRIRRGR